MAQQAPQRGYIGFLRGDRSYLTFQFNPSSVDRSRRATYADNQAAKADFPNSSSPYPAFKWIRNNAEEFSIELLFYAAGDEDVEEQLQKLDLMMRPDPNTTEPPDLIFAMGSRTDRVRIVDKSVKEELHSPDLRVQQARVNLKLRALLSRSA